MDHSSTLGFSPRPPVSVCGTGVLYVITISGFSWKQDYGRYPLGRNRAVLSGSTSRADLPTPNISTPFNALFRQCAGLSLLRRRFSCIKQYWNINQLSIDFAFRLRLRPRLTLIRLALIRNPWPFGVRVSHPHYRYLCLHVRFQTLQLPLQVTFCAVWNAPLPSRVVGIHRFGNMLNARLLSMPDRSTSELLRTL